MPALSQHQAWRLLDVVLTNRTRVKTHEYVDRDPWGRAIPPLRGFNFIDRYHAQVTLKAGQLCAVPIPNIIPSATSKKNRNIDNVHSKSQLSQPYSSVPSSSPYHRSNQSNNSSVNHKPIKSADVNAYAPQSHIQPIPNLEQINSNITPYTRLNHHANAQQHRAEEQRRQEKKKYEQQQLLERQLHHQQQHEHELHQRQFLQQRVLQHQLLQQQQQQQELEKKQQEQQKLHDEQQQQQTQVNEGIHFSHRRKSKRSSTASKTSKGNEQNLNKNNVKDMHLAHNNELKMNQKLASLSKVDKQRIISTPSVDSHQVETSEIDSTLTSIPMVIDAKRGGMSVPIQAIQRQTSTLPDTASDHSRISSTPSFGKMGDAISSSPSDSPRVQSSLYSRTRTDFSDLSSFTSRLDRQSAAEFEEFGNEALITRAFDDIEEDYEGDEDENGVVHSNGQEILQNRRDDDDENNYGTFGVIHSTINEKVPNHTALYGNNGPNMPVSHENYDNSSMSDMHSVRENVRQFQQQQNYYGNEGYTQSTRLNGSNNIQYQIDRQEGSHVDGFVNNGVQNTDNRSSVKGNALEQADSLGLPDTGTHTGLSYGLGDSLQSYDLERESALYNEAKGHYNNNNFYTPGGNYGYDAYKEEKLNDKFGNEGGQIRLENASYAAVVANDHGEDAEDIDDYEPQDPRSDSLPGEHTPSLATVGGIIAKLENENQDRKASTSTYGTLNDMTRSIESEIEPGFLFDVNGEEEDAPTPPMRSFGNNAHGYQRQQHQQSYPTYSNESQGYEQGQGQSFNDYYNPNNNNKQFVQNDRGHSHDSSEGAERFPRDAYAQQLQYHHHEQRPDTHRNSRGGFRRRTGSTTSNGGRRMGRFMDRDTQVRS